MEKLLIFFTISLLLVTAHAHAHAHAHGVKKGANRHGHGSLKLFVFGDSYVDTGNWKKSIAPSLRQAPFPWRLPYGITFPGEPTGRFSDGRVFTDYIASFVGIRSPVPYQQRKISTKLLRYGINFAYGGTGVFDTYVNEPNMTAQINFFQQILKEKVYAKQDLESSIAIVSSAGNDYGTYLLAENGTIQGLPSFIASVIKQLDLNLKRIRGLGVAKIGVTAIEPLGCVPLFTALYSYQNCSEIENYIARFHNQLLHKTVQKLNKESKESVFVILDLYSAFMHALKIQRNHPGTEKSKMSLKPCCVGVSSEYSCGSVDENGVKRYKVCKNPKSAFFWDIGHPSQNGWDAVSSALQSSFRQLL